MLRVANSARDTARALSPFRAFPCPCRISGEILLQNQVFLRDFSEKYA